MTPPKYSIIVPVYNRPAELRELLDSLTRQTSKNFEVIIVDDGSDEPSQAVCDEFSDRLIIKYFFKLNSGPGPTRNFGFEKASGDYLVMFDSDCIIPHTYFEAVENFMRNHPVDAWGGPDRGHENFTVLQQAMAYTMQSFWTTGGIRGGKNQADKFQPRSFNMGFSRKVWLATKGFAFDRLAEDIELSIRMREAGFKVVLITDAFVYHKRRTNLWEFFKQVEGFGRGRVRVGGIHKGTVKLTHWFPTLYMIYFILAIAVLMSWRNEWSEFVILPLYLHFTALFLSCYFQTAWQQRKEINDDPRVATSIALRSLAVSMLTVPAAVVQLTGYGLGFLREKLGV